MQWQSGVTPWHWSIVSDSLFPLMSEMRWLLSEHLPTTPLQYCSKLHPIQLSQMHWLRHKQSKISLLLSPSTLFAHVILNLPLSLHSAYRHTLAVCVSNYAALAIDQYWECSYRLLKLAIIFREGDWWATSSSSSCNHSLGKSTDENARKERKSNFKG